MLASYSTNPQTSFTPRTDGNEQGCYFLLSSPFILTPSKRSNKPTYVCYMQEPQACMSSWSNTSAATCKHKLTSMHAPCERLLLSGKVGPLRLLGSKVLSMAATSLVKTAALITLWEIWLERNGRIFQEIDLPAVQLCQKIRDAIIVWSFPLPGMFQRYHESRLLLTRRKPLGSIY